MAPHEPLPTARMEPANDGLPMVARRPGGRSVLWFVGAAVLGGALLFQALEARRQKATAPAVAASQADLAAAPAPPPALFIPAEPRPMMPARAFVTAPAVAAWGREAPLPQPEFAPAQAPAYRAPGEPIVVVQPSRAISTGPLLVIGAQAAGGVGEATSPDAQLPPAPPPGARGAPGAGTIARITNPSMTVPQGTLITGVLETALDSSRAGQARALVSRDVRSFDGKIVLIPRGSRLYGEYRADAGAGQRRALIQWTRLLLPDGVTVALDSPVSDPLGRAGVTGSVDTHFFERFGGALLQTTLNIGMGVALQELYNGPVISALPGTANTVAPPTLTREIPTTIKVKPGTRISVLVAHDLVFAMSSSATEPQL